MNSSKTPGKKHQNWLLAAMLISIPCMLLVGCQAFFAIQPTQTPEVLIYTATPHQTTETPTIVPTNTATPWQPLTVGDGIPAGMPVLSIENIAGLQVLGSWGDGIAYDMQWSPDGNLLAISTSRVLLLIDPQRMVLQKRIPVTYPLYSLAFSADGNILYGGGAQSKLFEYDLMEETLDELPLILNSPITALASGHTRAVLLAADWKAAVRMVDLQDDVQAVNLMTTLQGSQALGFSADDKKIYTWSTIEPIKRWNVATQKMEQEIYFGLDANQKTGSQVRFSSDGTNAAINQTWQVRVQNLEDGTTLGLFSGFKQPVLDLCISSDGAFVFTLQKDKIQVWESQKSKPVAEIMLTNGIENSHMLRLSADDSRLVLLGNVLTSFSWNADTRQIEENETLPLVLSSAESFGPPSFSGMDLDFALLDGTFLHFNLERGVYTHVPKIGEKDAVAALTGGNGVIVQAFADRTMQLTWTDTQQPAMKISGMSQPAAKLLLAPQSGYLAAQTGQQLSGLWNLTDGSFFKKQNWDVVVERLIFSPDEKYLIASGAGKTQIFEFANDSFSGVIDGRFLAASKDGILLERYGINEMHLELINYDDQRALHQFPGGARQAVINADEFLLVAGGENLVIWNLFDDQKITEIPNPAPMAKIFFSDDGRAILLAAMDGSVIVLGVPPSE